MRIRTLGVSFLIVVLGAAPAFAQQNIVDPSAMRQAIVDQTAVDNDTRETVLSVLKDKDVQKVAKRLGLDVKRAETAVAALDSAALATLAAPARAARANNTIIISTTTLLLILIIIILLVK